MTPEAVVHWTGEALRLALLVSAPMLIAALVVGLVVSLLQALTQLQEMTLAFVPKIVAVFVAGLLAAPWATEKLVAFARALIQHIPDLVQ